MPFASNNGVRIYWRSEGEAANPPLLLLNSIGTDLSLYDLAAPLLRQDFRLIRIDTRGHGASDAPDGDYTLDDLAGDVLAVMDAASAAKAAVCGTSLGGMIGMTLGLKSPERISALILACTSAKMDPQMWRDRLKTVRAEGMGPVADAAIGRFFSEAFRRNHPEEVEGRRDGLLATSPAGYAGCGAAIRDMNIFGDLAKITAPTLVIAGEKDPSTPFPDHGAKIAEAIPGAKSALLDTAHLPSIEDPSGFAGLVRGFLGEVLGGGAAKQAADVLFDEGLKVRRKVLGDAYVDKALAARTDFTADYQAMITRYAWNGIWGRPGLDHRTRRLLVLAICAALARWEEFRLHARAGLEQGGFTEAELKETLMQIAIYAGVPAANTAFAEAAAIMRELEA